MRAPLMRICLSLALGLAVLPILSACSDGGKDRKETLRPDRDPFNDGLTLVSQWNELALAGVRDGAAKPTIVTRQLFMLSAAMYDAWSAFDTVATPYLLDPALKASSADLAADQERAVSQAAYQVLIKAFPGYQEATGNFTKQMKRLGYPILAEGSADTADGIGFMAAKAVLKARADDGSNEAGSYADIVSLRFPELYSPVNSADPNDAKGFLGLEFLPNKWAPLRVPTGTLKDDLDRPVVDASDPASFRDQTFLTPHWGDVTPFALSSADQFEPPAPPLFGDNTPYTDGTGDNTRTNDEAWRAQFEEVLEINQNLDDYQRSSAEFWADGPRTESPPGHWNQMAHGIAARDQHTLDDDVKMYFALNGALLDAAIAVWDSKRVHDSARPAASIPYLHQNDIISARVPKEGVIKIRGEDWRPYQNATFVTPAFPEYVSGHSAFSRSAAEVLTLYTGSNTFYDGQTITPEDVNDDGAKDVLGEFIVAKDSLIFDTGPDEPVVLRWPTFQDAADEAGLSRIYGGIHIQDGDLRARELGRLIGVQAYEAARTYWSGERQR